MGVLVSLKNKSLSAVLWSGVDIFTRRGMQFIISLILARLLTPEEFGTIAVLYLFTGVAGTFVDSGFSSALIQRQDITHTDESTVFWFNLLMGFLVAVILWSLAPWVASFFDLAVLTPLAKVMAVNVFISALGAIHNTLLIKKLDFKLPMKIGAISTFLSGVAAVFLAMNNYGVWALAIQAMIATILTTSLLWFFSPWRPQMVFSLFSARRLFGFGSYLLLSGLLDTIYNRAYTLLIGKFYSIRELGFYNRAEGTKQLPVGLLNDVFSRVAFPVFSEAAHDKQKLRRGVQLALRSMMLINLPVMFGLMATAEPVVVTLFGSQWLPSVPMLQVLCLVGALWPLHVINLNVLMAQGHSRLFFRLEIIKKIVGTVFLIIGAQFGVLGIAWSQVFFGVAAFLINAHYTRLYLDYGFVQQILDFLPAATVAAIMAIIVYALGLVIILPDYLILLAQLSIGAAFFIGCSYLSNLQAFNDLWYLISKRRFPAPVT